MGKREVSISSSFQYGIPIEDQLPLIAEAGFTHVSLGGKLAHSGYLVPKQRNELRSHIEGHGLVVDTIHACGLDKPDAVPQLSATIEAAVDLKAPCIVAHVGPFNCSRQGLEDRVETALTTCGDLASVAKGSGVVVALENVLPGPATDLVRKVLQETDTETFGLCYDSAHDQIDGPRPFDLIDEFKNRIFAVHLSDRIKEFVDHVIPGEGFINWSEMCGKLRSAGYNGRVLMEVMMTHSMYQTPEEFLREARHAAVESWNLINTAKHRAIV